MDDEQFELVMKVYEKEREITDGFIKMVVFLIIGITAIFLWWVANVAIKDAMWWLYV
jgi:hypothetical protein